MSKPDLKAIRERCEKARSITLLVKPEYAQLVQGQFNHLWKALDDEFQLLDYIQTLELELSPLPENLAQIVIDRNKKLEAAVRSAKERFSITQKNDVEYIYGNDGRPIGSLGVAFAQEWLKKHGGLVK